MRHLGTALIALGLLLLGYAGLWQLGLAPGSRLSLPEPVALQRTGGAAAPLDPAHPEPAPTEVVWADVSDPSALAAPTAATHDPSALATDPPLSRRAASDPSAVSTRLPAPAPAASSTLALPLVAPDAADRHLDARRPPPGYAVRLSIPAIKLDTPVRQGGIVQGAAGQPVWQTLPFVAVHYGDLTALVGARGNAVIAGHVATLREGNVFRFLYQVDLGDTIQVWDEHDREHDFQVTDVKLVPPSDVSVMDPTPDPTLTLITCGGTFDPVKREFSDRLIVVAKPK